MQIVNGWAFPDEDRFMAAHIGEDGSYQRSHLDHALTYVKEYKVAVDGGAHVGTWSRPLSIYFSHVISFEPSADTYECLVYNLETFQRKNVDARNQALGKEPGRIKMTLEGFDRGIELGNTGARFVRPGGDVERITLDSLKLDNLNFLKLDIEGSEVDALIGAKETLLKYKPTILFEDKNFWKRYGYGRQAPQEFLTSLGAKHLERISMDEIWGW